MSGKLTIVSDFVCPYCYWLETGAYAETVRRESCLSREALGIRMVPTILAGDKRLEGFVPDLDALRAWLDEVRREA